MGNFIIYKELSHVTWLGSHNNLLKSLSLSSISMLLIKKLKLKNVGMTLSRSMR